MENDILKKGFAELIATATLTAVVLGVLGRTTFPLFVAIGAGLTVGLMVLLVGKVSGAHANPAITLGFLSKKMITVSDAIMYIAMQLLGAFLALGLYQYLSDRTVPISDSSFDWRVFMAEAAGAFLFGFGVISGVLQKFSLPTLASVIGTSLLLGILIASAGSNAIVNPAVALGLKSFTLSYILGPIVGAIAGMQVYSYLFDSNKKR